MLQKIASPIPLDTQTKVSKRRQSTLAEISDFTCRMCQGLRFLHAIESSAISVSQKHWRVYPRLHGTL